MAFAQTLLKKMLSDSLTEKHYDVYFHVQQTLHDGTLSETRLGAHRVVLSAVSDMFEQQLTKSDPSRGVANEIIIRNCSAAAVRESLEIMYGGELRDAKTSVLLALEIWHFGVLFHVDHLIQLARASCLENLSTDNCLRILDFAVHVEDVEIVDKLQNYASENANFSHVITSPDFERLDFKVVSSLVRPGKGECAWPEILTFEKVWFDALVKWLTSRISYQPYKDPPAKEQPLNGAQPQTPSIVRYPTQESIVLVQKILALIDFTRMKTHELRDVSKNEIAVMSPAFAGDLVTVLLTRAEQLEGTILERNIDLDVLGQKYQQALCEHDEAERKARAAIEKTDKLQAAKQLIEKRYEELRRRRPPTSSNGPSMNSARRKSREFAFFGSHHGGSRTGPHQLSRSRSLIGLLFTCKSLGINRHNTTSGISPASMNGASVLKSPKFRFMLISRSSIRRETFLKEAINSVSSDGRLTADSFSPAR